MLRAPQLYTALLSPKVPTAYSLYPFNEPPEGWLLVGCHIVIELDS